MKVFVKDELLRYCSLKSIQINVHHYRLKWLTLQLPQWKHQLNGIHQCTTCNFQSRASQWHFLPFTHMKAAMRALTDTIMYRRERGYIWPSRDVGQCTAIYVKLHFEADHGYSLVQLMALKLNNVRCNGHRCISSVCLFPSTNWSGIVLLCYSGWVF